MKIPRSDIDIAAAYHSIASNTRREACLPMSREQRIALVRTAEEFEREAAEWLLFAKKTTHH